MGNGTNQAVAALLDLQGYNYLQNGSVTSPIFDGQHSWHPDLEDLRQRRWSREGEAAALIPPPPTIPELGQLRRLGQGVLRLPRYRCQPRGLRADVWHHHESPLVRRGVRLDRLRLRGRAVAVSPATPRAPISASSTPPASPRTATTSGRAAVRPRPWSTSSRIGTGRPERR